MNRITITVPPAVSQLLKQKVNRSHYISDLILRDAYEGHKDELVERAKKAILEDEGFVSRLMSAVQGTSKVIDDVSITTPEETA